MSARDFGGEEIEGFGQDLEIEGDDGGQLEDLEIGRLRSREGSSAVVASAEDGLEEERRRIEFGDWVEWEGKRVMERALGSEGVGFQHFYSEGKRKE